MDGVQLEAYITETYGATGEHLFANYPNFVVFRHADHRKWFAVIMELPKEKVGIPARGDICVVNLKCDSRLIGSFRLEPGIYPAYHMSKNHWLTVALDGTVDEDKIRFLLGMSFDLTKRTKR